jgi:hypothetical protein
MEPQSSIPVPPPPGFFPIQIQSPPPEKGRGRGKEKEGRKRGGRPGRSRSRPFAADTGGPVQEAAPSHGRRLRRRAGNAATPTSPALRPSLRRVAPRRVVVAAPSHGRRRRVPGGPERLCCHGRLQHRPPPVRQNARTSGLFCFPYLEPNRCRSAPPSSPPFTAAARTPR